MDVREFFAMVEKDGEQAVRFAAGALGCDRTQLADAYHDAVLNMHRRISRGEQVHRPLAYLTRSIINIYRNQTHPREDADVPERMEPDPEEPDDRYDRAEGVMARVRAVMGDDSAELLRRYADYRTSLHAPISAIAPGMRRLEIMAAVRRIRRFIDSDPVCQSYRRDAYNQPTA